MAEVRNMKSKQQTWLINLLYQHPEGLTLPEIDRYWQMSINYDNTPITRNSLFRARTTIANQYGISIECERHSADSRYHIPNIADQQQSSVKRWLYSTIAVGNIISDHLSLKDCILLENVKVKPMHLQTIMQAVKSRYLINIVYKKYMSDSTSERTLSPLALKLWNQRWYMLANQCDSSVLASSARITFDNLRVFSLDRIQSVEITTRKFVPPKSFSPQEYFSECYGVYTGGNAVAEHVVLRAFGQTPYYLRDLPLHHTQHEINTTDAYTDFELYLRPTVDFQNQLLTHGAGIQVLRPAHLADEIKARVKEMLKLYETE